MAPEAGLCDSCRHQQLVSNTRGSTFSLCRRSRTDPAFPKYPRLPVLACAGYERRAEEDDVVRAGLERRTEERDRA